MISFKYMYKSVMAIGFVITLFSCEGNYQNVQKLAMGDNLPFAELTGVNSKYTDSGKVVANLRAPELKDYSNFEFPYREFPKGIELYFWEDDELSTVVSDYAIQYEETGLVDLRRNVVLTTSDSVVLKADQLYWDQSRQWLFTDQD
ncbi:MAG: LPS export ABC transporter periplasmic protein LptC, partial [Marinirhabdus sp.]|nr:LPS export ABC transporter periplasmic protein LptC [Marinirhabdus sp.]